MASQQPRLERPDILIVDDTPANLHLLSQMLSERGFKVRAVVSGARALAAARTRPPDLILLDIRMPEMNGYEVCQHLKADARTRDVPVIFISALSEIQDKVKAFAEGGVDYITKPFQLEEVLARVETHLTLRDLQRQLQQANRRFERELALAREVQASFLPSQLPELPGWDLSVNLQSAREMSGDFYDVGLLPNGCVSLLVADVVDKGVGAALFMALCNTLIRTYATEYPAEPGRVLAAANARILSDTSSEQFVTAFYGVLDPSTGLLSFVNAGHDPPCLVNGSGDSGIQLLVRTGMPLGILPDAAWEEGAAQLAPGDMLVLYTDGIPDAQNSRGQFYGRERLLQVIQKQRGRRATVVLEEILSDLNRFVGETPQPDDIALITLVYRPFREGLDANLACAPEPRAIGGESGSAYGSAGGEAGWAALPSAQA